MLCILAGNYQEASTWARGQQLDRSEWFYPIDISELSSRENFHILVIGSAGLNVPESYFNRIFNLAKSRGRINRT